MNKLRLLVLFVIPAFGFGQVENDSFHKVFSGVTLLNAGFYHLGSYSKENPSLSVEQHFEYRLHKRVSLSAGIGVSLYPRALAFPAEAGVVYFFNINRRESRWMNSLGANLKLRMNSFFSYRHQSLLEITLNQDKRVQILPHFGYNLLFDQFGGAAVSFIAGVGAKYKLKI